MRFRVKNAKDKEAVKQYIDQMQEGRRYNVSVTLHREKRSVDQNRLLWLWLSCICDETGQDRDDLHEYFKQKFLGYDTRTVFNSPVYRWRSTTSLDTKEFTTYLERIQAFASAELGITLPNPEDVFWDQFYEQYKNYV